MLIPFFLARLILVLPKGCACWSGRWRWRADLFCPIIIEARLSPQINVWVYGFFAHDFSQSMRGGGFRAMVFMPHGLWWPFFVLMAAMSALAILRHAPAERRHVWLAFVAVADGRAGLVPQSWADCLCGRSYPPDPVCATAGAVAGSRCDGRGVVTYPALRGAHLVPLDDILSFARSISTDRAISLEYRIINEEVLLDRAQEKPWFGWGGYGRALILDPVTGRILSIPDGGWIIVLGNFGWLGYVGNSDCWCCRCCCWTRGDSLAFRGVRSGGAAVCADLWREPDGPSAQQHTDFPSPG